MSAAQKQPRLVKPDVPRHGDRHFAQCYWDIEPEVCNLARAARLVALLKFEVDDPELTGFAIEVLERIMKEFKTRYDASF
jgi:hypothetical protein